MVLLKDLASSLLPHVLFYLHIVTLGDFPIIVSTLMRKKTIVPHAALKVSVSLLYCI